MMLSGTFVYLFLYIFKYMYICIYVYGYAWKRYVNIDMYKYICTMNSFECCTLPSCQILSITIFKVTSRFIGHEMNSSEIFFCFINFWISFIGSCCIGYSMGMMIALIYKHVDFSNHRLSAVSLFVCIVYIPFFLAEVLQLSGIVTILFCGIASRRYINKNLPQNAR
jgi:ABC-type multidrug transport system fused ATPase/permease subunit